jgi:hypothetical protein
MNPDHALKAFDPSPGEDPLRADFIIGSGSEPEMMAAFERVIFIFTQSPMASLYPSSVARAAAWLAQKYPLT